MELRTLADWTIKQRLLAVSGVAKVTVFGGEVKQFQVQVRPEQLVAYDLAIDDVLAAAGRATGVRGAGFIENDSQRIVLQSEGQSLTAEQLAQSVVRQNQGAVVRLGDLGQVVEAPEPPIGAAAIMGKTGVMLIVSSQFGANTLEVTRNVEQALAELKPALQAQDVVLDTDLFRPANFIETSTHNVRNSLLIGAVLVVIVLTLFLFNLRTAAISCSAIPLSLLAAVIVLQRLGYSLNTMTLGGLAIAIGEVVDDAVIDVENILRRLRENRHLPKPLSVLQVVFHASIEVRSAVVYATFAVILVFVPILTMSGVAGRLFAPLGLAYIFAILASLVVALTVTPALCMVFLGSQHFKEEEPPLVRGLKARYVRLLERVEANSKAVLVTVGVITVLGLATLPFIGGGFLPELHEGHFHRPHVRRTGNLAQRVARPGPAGHAGVAEIAVRALGRPAHRSGGTGGRCLWFARGRIRSGFETIGRRRGGSRSVPDTPGAREISRREFRGKYVSHRAHRGNVVRVTARRSSSMSSAMTSTLWMPRRKKSPDC